MKKKYLVTVINSAGDFIAHARFDTLKGAREYAKTLGQHCVIEIYKFLEDNL